MKTLRINAHQFSTDLMKTVMDNLKNGQQTTPIVLADACGKPLLQAEVRVTHMGGVKMTKALCAGLAGAQGLA